MFQPGGISRRAQKKEKPLLISPFVGKTGFEPATPWSQTRCATGLRYFPNFPGTPLISGAPSRVPKRGAKIMIFGLSAPFKLK